MEESRHVGNRGWVLWTLAMLFIASVAWVAESQRPAALPSITIDKERLCPLVDGKPFFAIGACWIPEYFMKDAAEAGFNLTVRWGSGGAGIAGYNKAEAGGEMMLKSFLLSYLDAAQAAGLWVVDFPSLFGGVADRGDFLKPDWIDYYVNKFVPNRLLRIIDIVKDHPALFGYYSIDEPPENDQVRAACAAYAKAVRARDPEHPIYLLFGGPVQDWPETRDIVGRDWYLFTDEMPLICLYHVARQEARQAVGKQEPFWFIPLMEFHQKRPPSALHQQAQTYLAVIAGANGLVWWWWPPMHAQNWAMFKELGKELRALTPVITEPPAPTQIRYEPSSLRNTIQVRAIRHENATWLIAANATKTPATARFTLPVEGRGPVKVWFENREVAVAGRQFTDRFDGLSRHVYEVAAQWPQEMEIGLNITLQPLATEAPLPPDRDPLCPNLLSDSGFEGDLHWVFGRTARWTGKAQGRFDETSRHGGKRSALVEWTDASGPADWCGPWVQLKPNTGYTFGGWARAEVEGPVGHQAVIMNLQSSMEFISQLALIDIDHFAPWRKYSLVFRTGSQPVCVRPLLRVNPFSNPDAKNSGKARFDDMFLIEADAGVRNLVANGGFEGPQNLPGWPRWWTYEYSNPAPGTIGGPNALWGLDEASPFEGRACFRMTNKEKTMVAPPFGNQMARQDLAVGTWLEAGRDYVLSAWMRSDTPGFPVTMRAGDYDLSKTVRLTTEWQRYSHSVRRSKNSYNPHVAFACERGAGTVWIDAVQFEEGTEATEYKEWKE